MTSNEVQGCFGLAIFPTRPEPENPSFFFPTRPWPDFQPDFENNFHFLNFHLIQFQKKKQQNDPKNQFLEPDLEKRSLFEFLLAFWFSTRARTWSENFQPENVQPEASLMKSNYENFI